MKCIGCDDIDFGAHFLKLSVVVGCIFNFSWAVKRKGCWHENQDRPFALEAFVRNGDELTVVEGLGFEGQNGGIDNGHDVPFSGGKKLSGDYI